MSKSLVIYYSRRGQNFVSGDIRELQKGNAEVIAEFIRDAADADVFEIRPVKDYPEDYMACTEVAKEELRQNARPELKEYLDDVSDYDKVFICGPCWWGTYPMPVFSLLERLDLDGKKVFPVMTHEGSSLGSCERDLRRVCRGASIAKGLAIQGSVAPDSENAVRKWVTKMVR